MKFSARADVCDSKGAIVPSVKSVLTLVARRMHADVPADWTLSEANAFAQAHLIRPRGCERLGKRAIEKYQSTFARLAPEERAQVEVGLAAAGFYDSVLPHAAAFDYILLNGSTVDNVRQRIDALAQAVSSGALKIAANTKIVFLDGERPLFASETCEKLLHPQPYQIEPAWSSPARLPTDEREMDEMLWAQMRLPQVLRKQPILFVHAEKKSGAPRAETADCVETWVKSYRPSSGRALVVSNNPFIEYQRRVTEVLLAQFSAAHFEVAAMGPAAVLGQYGPERVNELIQILLGI